jgi:2-C-methyl-D-erythritol 4-phosphate cytidylyltransferase
VTTQQIVRGDVAVLVAAAGMGVRLGPGGPKALRVLGGASLLAHAVRRLGGAPSVGCVVVAAPVGHLDEASATLAAELPPGIESYAVAGGEHRQHSVAAALAIVPTAYPIILVHDAARAFAPPSLVERVAAAVREGHDAVIPVLPVVDTIKRVDETGHVVDTVDRSVLRAVQTPQGFRHDVLTAAHRWASAPEGAASASATDDAGLVERAGVKVFCVPGDDRALKITRPADLALVDILSR